MKESPVSAVEAIEPFRRGWRWVSMWCGDEDGREDRGGSAWAAAELDQDLSVLEQRHGALVGCADAGVCPVDRSLAV
jgi:hypothetical protein